MWKIRPLCTSMQKRARKNDPVKANLIQTDVTAVIVSHVNMVANMKEWIVDSAATRHSCPDINAFSSSNHLRIWKRNSLHGRLKNGSSFWKTKSSQTDQGKNLNDVQHVPNV